MMQKAKIHTKKAKKAKPAKTKPVKVAAIRAKSKKPIISRQKIRPAKALAAKTQKTKAPAPKSQKMTDKSMETSGAKAQKENTSATGIIIPKAATINLPSKTECDEMMKRWGMPENIMRHSLQVNRVSMFLAKKLKDSGLKINLALVDKGSLLHDLDKIRTLKTDQHGIVAKEFLTNKGYPEVGDIASWHRFSFIKDSNLPWEAKIVNYADKRVKHDKIVSLQDRFADLLMRYDVKTPDHEAIQCFFQLEKEIFTRIKLDPDKLESYLR
jgi:uncharacterized protein